MSTPNVNAKAGEVIAGNLGRSETGQFTNAAQGGGDKAKPQADKKPVAKPAAKPGSAAANQQRVMRATRAGGIGPKSFAAMNALRSGKAGDQKTLAILARSGLVKPKKGGGFELSPEGKKFMTSADKGDAKGAQAAVRAARPRQKPKPAAKPAAKPAQKPAAQATKLDRYLDIQKSDDEQRLVYGIASTETPDAQGGVWKGERYEGDLVKAEAMAEALDEYMRYANVREMHGSSAAGSVQVAHVQEDGQTAIVVKVADDGAWAKVKDSVYKGFSIGGRVVEAKLEQIGGKMIRVITKLLLTEISLVDRPACPDAQILLFKRDTSMDENDVQKAADASKVISQIQALRNEAELAGDLDGANLYTQAIALVLQANGDAAMAEEEPADESGDELEMSADSESDGAVMMAAKADLKKAGRVFSGSNQTQMHKTVQALLQMMANAGDETAQKALACYGPAEQPTMKAEDLASATGDALAKVLGPQFDSLTKTLESFGSRLTVLEKQPAPGGPALRVVEKQIAGQPATIQNPAQLNLAELRKRANTEPNPTLRAEYNRQLIIAEQSLGQR